MIEVLADVRVVIIFHYINGSNQCIYIYAYTMSYVNYSSIKLGWGRDVEIEALGRLRTT